MEIPIDPELLKLAAASPYTPEMRGFAVRLGFCQALADHGLTPTDLSREMSKRASVTDGAASIASAVPGFYAKGTIAAVLAAIAAGSQTGKFHHRLERRFEKSDDPELVKLREQMTALAQARNELADDLESRAMTPPTAAPASKPKKKPKAQDPVALLD